jgi:hypothetical protein
MEDNLLEYQKLKDELEQVCTSLVYPQRLDDILRRARAEHAPARPHVRSHSCTPSGSHMRGLTCKRTRAAARCESCVACFRVAHVQVFVDVVGLNEALDASDGESDLSDSDHSDEEVRMPWATIWYSKGVYGTYSGGTKGYSGVLSASAGGSDISESGRSDEEADPHPYPLPFQCPQYCLVLPLVPPDPKHKSRRPRNSLSTPEPHGLGRCIVWWFCFQAPQGGDALSQLIRAQEKK